MTEITATPSNGPIKIRCTCGLTTIMNVDFMDPGDTVLCTCKQTIYEKPGDMVKLGSGE